MNNQNESEDASASSDVIDSCLDQALRFSREDPDAVVLSLWPSAILGHLDSRQIDAARSYLEDCGAAMVHEASLELTGFTEASQTLLIMAAYWGEDWLETNCWYGEQPLEELGLPPPTGSWPGAKWKQALCFRQDSEPLKMHVFVARVSRAAKRRSLWSQKYTVRSAMARDTGHAGNSCMHLTDDQSGILTQNRQHALGGHGMDCNASYAFCCARLLLNPFALQFLVDCSTHQFPSDADWTSNEFRDTFGEFCAWLGDQSWEDVVLAEDSSGRKIKQWNRPNLSSG